MKQVGINVVVVHRGVQIDNELNKVGIKRNFKDGIRITDNNTIKIVSETLTNLVNKEIVGLINKNGGNSIGIAKDNNSVIKAKKYTSKDQDYGYVPAEIVDVDSNYLYDLMKSNYIPVIAPLGFDSDNNIFNINADSAASAIASHLSAEKLIFLTDQSGVLDDKEELISSLNFEEIESLINSNIITGGSATKNKSLFKCF